MFIRLAPRVAGDRDGVAESWPCGRLPLAVSLQARVFVRHPSWNAGRPYRRDSYQAPDHGG